MADEPMNAASSVLPVPPTSDIETNQPEDVIKASDVPIKDIVSGANGTDDPARSAAAPAAAATKTNGGSEQQPSAPSKPTTVHAQEADEDTTMKDADDAGAPNETATRSVAPANDTPVSKKVTSNGGPGSSKKKAAVPEHKSKKLSKKKSRPMTNLDAQPGDYYLARMKGHAPWPSIVCDEEMLPNSLLVTRPITARLPDRTFRKPDYDDGGKRAHERTFPVMFLHTNEFAWITNTELTPLDLEDDSVKAPSEKGKSKFLLAAYAKAAEANDLQHFKTMLAEHQKALQQDIEEREAIAAEKAAAKKAKKSRKSSDAATLGDDGDAMDVDDDEAAEKPKSKKRKKADDSDADEKPAKTPKTGAKLKLSAPKAESGESSSKKKSASKPKAKATKSSSEDDAATPKVEEKPVTPEQAREMKERKVLYYRHKLQRGLLSRDSIPKEEEMKPMSEFLHELEEYPDLEGSIIRITKIHKVLKQILKLGSIPLEEDFKFKDRSRDLLAKWNETLNNDPTGSGDKDEKDGDEPKTPGLPTTNGESSKPAATEEEKTQEAEKAAAPEVKPVEKLEKKIGTTVEGEKEADDPKAEEKAQEKAENAEEKKDDGPAVASAPAGEFKPAPAAESAAEPTA